MPPLTLAQATKKIEAYTDCYHRRTGTQLNSVPGVKEAVIGGLAHNLAELNRPLCPCNFYPDKVAELRHRRWLCPCDEMQIYKYCHCMLYVGENNLPITEHLPPQHEGRQMYGLNPDPHPELGRPRRGQTSPGMEEGYAEK